MKKIIAAVIMAVSLVACGGGHQNYQNQGMQYDQQCDPSYTDCSQVPQNTMGYYDNNHGFHWGSAAIGAAAGFLLARHHYRNQSRYYPGHLQYSHSYMHHYYGGYHTVHVYHYHYRR